MMIVCSMRVPIANGGKRLMNLIGPLGNGLHMDGDPIPTRSVFGIQSQSIINTNTRTGIGKQMTRQHQPLEHPIPPPRHLRRFDRKVLKTSRSTYRTDPTLETSTSNPFPSSSTHLRTVLVVVLMRLLGRLAQISRTPEVLGMS